MTYSFSITRTFDAPRDLVFDAWTRPEHFSVWFGTDAVSVPLESLSMDVREGGTWSAIMVLPDGSTKDWAGEYVEIDRPQRLVLTMTDEPQNPARGTITVVLAETDGGTELTMTQAGEGMTQEQSEGARVGWGAFLDVMAGLVAR